jgi:DNA-binding NarL/FixJ family response regulator
MLVEDRGDFRRGIASFLERQPDTEVIAQAGSLKEARRHIASVGCDVAVLDLGLPDGNGANLIGELREVCPDSAVLILSASLGMANLTRTQEAGLTRCWTSS